MSNLDSSDLKTLFEFETVHFTVTLGFHGTFFRSLRPKMSDFAAAFLQISGDICGISYCFEVENIPWTTFFEHCYNFSDFEDHHRAPD